MLLISTSEVAAAVNLCLVISTDMCEQRTPVRGVIKGSVVTTQPWVFSTSATGRNCTLCTAAAATGNLLYNHRPPHQPRMHSLAWPPPTTDHFSVCSC